MGLRVGAQPRDLNAPGPSMTLAGLKQAAETPVGSHIPKMQPTELPKDVKSSKKGGFDPAELLSELQSLKPMGDGNPAQAAMNYASGPMAGDVKNAASGASSGFMDMVKNHGFQAAGMALGGVGGGALAASNPITAGLAVPSAAAGAAGGAVLGQKIDAWIHDKPQPDKSDMMLTATEAAMLDLGGQAFHGLIKNVGSVTQAQSKTMESLTGPARDNAKNLMDYAGSKDIPVRQGQIAPDTVAGKTALERENLTAQGYMGARAQDQMQEYKLLQKAKIQHDLNNINQLLPSPKKSYDVGQLANNWLSGLKSSYGAIKEATFPKDQKISFDPLKVRDSLGTMLQDEGILDKEFKPVPLSETMSREPEALATRRKLQNFWVDFNSHVAAGNPIDPAASGVIRDAAEKFHGINPASAPIKILEQNSNTPFQMSLKDLDFLKENINQIAEGSSDKSVAKYVRKVFYQNYYDTIGDLAESRGNPEAGAQLKAQGRKLGMYQASVESVVDNIKKSPSAAIEHMVDKSDVKNTQNMTRWMTSDQFKSFRRAFLTNAVQNGADESGQVNAGSVRKYLSGFGEDNVNFILGEQKKPIMESLQYSQQLQSTDITMGARKGLLDRLVKSVAQLPNANAFFDILKSTITNPDVEKMLSSDEYAAKLYRMNKAYMARQAAAKTARVSTSLGMPIAAEYQEQSKKMQPK